MPKSKEKPVKVEAKKEKTVEMFCANDQVETAHILDIDGNGEILITCSVCGRFTKLPEGTDAKGVKEYIESHKESNIGQRSVESIEKKKAEILESLDL